MINKKMIIFKLFIKIIAYKIIYRLSNKIYIKHNVIAYFNIIPNNNNR